MCCFMNVYTIIVPVKPFICFWKMWLSIISTGDIWKYERNKYIMELFQFFHFPQSLHFPVYCGWLVTYHICFTSALKVTVENFWSMTSSFKENFLICVPFIQELCFVLDNSIEHSHRITNWLMCELHVVFFLWNVSLLLCVIIILYFIPFVECH